MSINRRRRETIVRGVGKTNFSLSLSLFCKSQTQLYNETEVKMSLSAQKPCQFLTFNTKFSKKNTKSMNVFFSLNASLICFLAVQRIIIPNKHGEKLVGTLHESGTPTDIVILCHGFRCSKVCFFFLFFSWLFCMHKLLYLIIFIKFKFFFFNFRITISYWTLLLLWKMLKLVLSVLIFLEMGKFMEVAMGLIENE